MIGRKSGEHGVMEAQRKYRKRERSDLDSAEILSTMRKKVTTGGFGEISGHRRQISSL